MSKFDKIIPKGSVPNCQLQIANRYDNRWFKCKLKPPKNISLIQLLGTTLSIFGVVRNERKRVSRKWKNAYLSTEDPRASRALKRALDPGCIWLAFHMTPLCNIGNFWSWKEYFIFKKIRIFGHENTYFVMSLSEL